MKFYVSRSRAGYVSAEDGEMYLRKIRVNKDSTRFGKMIDATSFEEAMALAEAALPMPVVEPAKPENRKPGEEGVGRFYLMKADKEHDNVDWVGLYYGNGMYKDQHDNKMSLRPVSARQYEVRRAWVRL